MIRALLEGARALADDVGRLLAEVNRELLAILGQASVPVFLSAFYAVVDVSTGLLHYANAGHPGPLLVRRREGMGLGDAKLLAMIAAWLGPANAMLTFFLAVVSGAVYGLLWLAAKKGKGGASAPLPLGSFLCAAAIYTAFEGRGTVAWYLSLFR